MRTGMLLKKGGCGANVDADTHLGAGGTCACMCARGCVSLCMPNGACACAVAGERGMGGGQDPARCRPQEAGMGDR